MFYTNVTREYCKRLRAILGEFNGIGFSQIFEKLNDW